MDLWWIGFEYIEEKLIQRSSWYIRGGKDYAGNAEASDKDVFLEFCYTDCLSIIFEVETAGGKDWKRDKWWD